MTLPSGPLRKLFFLRHAPSGMRMPFGCVALSARAMVLAMLLLAAGLLISAEAHAGDAATEDKPTRSIAYRIYLESEVGAVWQQRNEVAVPGGRFGGTKVNLLNIDNQTEPFYRINGYIDISEKQRVSFLYAPLQVELRGVLAEDVTYNNEEFTQGRRTTATYKFNSYRVSWSYRMSRDAGREWYLGVTGKVRDAAVGFQQQDVAAEFTNVGFVPLLYTTYVQYLANRFSLHVDFYGSAAPQGRALDLGVKVLQEIRPDWLFGAGVRTVEGGADNDKVYSFAWFHYAYLTIAYRS